MALDSQLGVLLAAPGVRIGGGPPVSGERPPCLWIITRYLWYSEYHIIACCLGCSIQIVVSIGVQEHNILLYQQNYSSVLDCCINRSILHNSLLYRQGYINVMTCCSNGSIESYQIVESIVVYQHNSLLYQQDIIIIACCSNRSIVT